VSKSSQLRQKAQAFLKKGKISDAIETYKKLLQVESRNPNLYNELGDIYLRADDRMQAVASFDKAVDHYEKVALYNNAVAVCKKILRVVPSRLDSIFKLGELKAKQKFEGEASRSFIQYLDLVSADEGGMHPDAIIPKVEAMLELVPGSEELHAKAAGILSHIGMRNSAAEIYAKLVASAAEKGDGEILRSYREKLDQIMGSLTDKEKAGIEEILGSSADVPDGAGSSEDELTVEEIDPNAAAVEAGSDPVEEVGIEAGSTVEPSAEPPAGYEPAAEIAGTEKGSSLPGETGETARVDVKGRKESDTDPGSGAGADTVEKEYEITEEPGIADELEAEDKAAEEYAIPAEPEVSIEPAPEAETVAAKPAPEAAEEQVKEYEIPVEPEAPVEPAAESEPAKEYVIPDSPEPVESGSEAAEVATDGLSDILDAEEEADDTSEVDTHKLAEEITSDVEENDFRSHYDLGMAYIEMALFNEAIKELQISARSEQLQLRSLEMIGHCFLQLGNPRLAVKQLCRGLELAISTGGDNLGIHYNLGLAYEALEQPEKAREHYEEVYIVDVTFRDISEKMKRYSTVS